MIARKCLLCPSPIASNTGYRVAIDYGEPGDDGSKRSHYGWLCEECYFRSVREMEAEFGKRPPA